MRKLGVFNFMSLNGCYKGANEDIGWHTHGGAEENEFSGNSAQGGGILLFGRVTYQMMANFWPTDAAKQSMPVVADGMNKAEKIVFSRTLKKAEWNNSRVMNGDIVEEMRKMKQTPGKDMTILGSGSIVTQFAEAGLIDLYQLMLDPVVIPGGVPIFNGIQSKLNLKLTNTRVFKSGNMLLCYEPMR